MIHDQFLVDYISGLPAKRLDAEVFRATGVGVDPTAPSITGGRWAPRPNGDPGVHVLYTSFDRNGCLAEVCSYLAALTPTKKPSNGALGRRAMG